MLPTAVETIPRVKLTRNSLQIKIAVGDFVYVRSDKPEIPDIARVKHIFNDGTGTFYARLQYMYRPAEVYSDDTFIPDGNNEILWTDHEENHCRMQTIFRGVRVLFVNSTTGEKFVNRLYMDRPEADLSAVKADFICKRQYNLDDHSVMDLLPETFLAVKFFVFTRSPVTANPEKKRILRPGEVPVLAEHRTIRVNNSVPSTTPVSSSSGTVKRPNAASNVDKVVEDSDAMNKQLQHALLCTDSSGRCPRKLCADLRSLCSHVRTNTKFNEKDQTFDRSCSCSAVCQRFDEMLRLHDLGNCGQGGGCKYPDCTFLQGVMRHAAEGKCALGPAMCLACFVFKMLSMKHLCPKNMRCGFPLCTRSKKGTKSSSSAVGAMTEAKGQLSNGSQSSRSNDSAVTETKSSSSTGATGGTTAAKDHLGSGSPSLRLNDSSPVGGINGGTAEAQVRSGSQSARSNDSVLMGAKSSSSIEVTTAAKGQLSIRSNDSKATGTKSANSTITPGQGDSTEAADNGSADVQARIRIGKAYQAEIPSLLPRPSKLRTAQDEIIYSPSCYDEEKEKELLESELDELLSQRGSIVPVAFEKDVALGQGYDRNRVMWWTRVHEPKGGNGKVGVVPFDCVWPRSNNADDFVVTKSDSVASLPINVFQVPDSVRERCLWKLMLAKSSLTDDRVLSGPERTLMRWSETEYERFVDGLSKGRSPDTLVEIARTLKETKLPEDVVELFWVIHSVEGVASAPAGMVACGACKSYFTLCSLVVCRQFFSCSKVLCRDCFNKRSVLDKWMRVMKLDFDGNDAESSDYILPASSTKSEDAARRFENAKMSFYMCDGCSSKKNLSKNDGRGGGAAVALTKKRLASLMMIPNQPPSNSSPNPMLGDGDENKRMKSGKKTSTLMTTTITTALAQQPKVSQPSRASPELPSSSIIDNPNKQATESTLNKVIAQDKSSEASPAHSTALLSKEVMSTGTGERIASTTTSKTITSSNSRKKSDSVLSKAAIAASLELAPPPSVDNAGPLIDQSTGGSPISRQSTTVSRFPSSSSSLSLIPKPLESESSPSIPEPLELESSPLIPEPIELNPWLPSTSMSGSIAMVLHRYLRGECSAESAMEQIRKEMLDEAQRNLKLLGNGSLS